MRLAFSAILVALVLPFALASAGGWGGQRSFSVELGSTLGISALALLAIVVILPTRVRALARLGADVAVRLHRHLVRVMVALLVGHIVLAVRPAAGALQPVPFLRPAVAGAGGDLIRAVPDRTHRAVDLAAQAANPIC